MSVNTAQLLDAIKSAGTGYKACDDPLFKEGNEKILAPSKRRMGVVSSAKAAKPKELIHCFISNCAQSFTTTADYEHHYKRKHRYMCTERNCKAIMDSAHYFDLHLSEEHDSYFEVMSKKKPSYHCLVPDCPDLFQTPQERTDHCRAVHVSERVYEVPKAMPMFKKKKEPSPAGTPPKSVNHPFGLSASKSFPVSCSKAPTNNKPKVPPPPTPLEDNRMVVDLLNSLVEEPPNSPSEPFIGSKVELNTE